MQTSFWILIFSFLWGYLCSGSATSSNLQKNIDWSVNGISKRNIYFQKVEELLSQVSVLQLKVQYVQHEFQELKESRQGKQICSKNDENQNCNENVLKELEKTVQNLKKDLQQEKLQLGFKLNSVEEACLANLQQIRESLKEKGVKLTEHTKDLASLNLTINTKASNLSDELEDIHKCLGTKCAIHDAGSIKSPSFVSPWFRMKVYDANISKVVIEHGLNELPTKVDVQIKSTSGAKNDWIFTGASVIQSDDDTGEDYGGVVYFFNESHIILTVPIESNNNKHQGYVVTTGYRSGFFIGSHHYKYVQGFVRVKIWLQNDFPKPAYTSRWLPLDRTNQKLSFHTVRHGLSEYPSLVTVQVRLGNMVSEAMGSILSPVGTYSNAGGVLYGYDHKMVRVWAAYAKTNSYGCLFGSNDGWGCCSMECNRGYFKVTVWAADSFNHANFYMRESNVMETEMDALTLPGIDVDNDLVSFYVQALDGPNSGFLFKGWGSSQATSKPFGGAIYAYNKEGKFQVWRPNAEKQGYMVHISSPYGNGQNIQASNSASYVAHLLVAQK